MKNITKTIKTMLFASLIAVMILPFSGMDFAEAKSDQHSGKDLIKNTKSDKDIPLQKELRKEIAKQHKEAKSDSDRKYLEKQNEKIHDEIQQWYTDNLNPSKEQFAREKQEILTDSIESEEKILGSENLRKQLPWTTIGYDYVDNALEVTIIPSEFTDDKIPKYLEKIRSIVGNEIDVTLSPQNMPVTECVDDRCEVSDPIKGGVEFDTTASGPCTIGFKATYSGYTGFVTAGHCADGLAGGSGDDVEQPDGGADIGNVIKEMWYNNSACDCAFISETHTTRSMDDGIYGLSDPNTTANPFVGMTVKISGKNSGIESGIVSDTSETIYYTGNTIKYLVVADYDSVGGDSGSPIVSGSSLIGIHSGSDQVGTDAYFTKHSKFTTYFSGLSWGF